jgi:hypothetical protein
LADQITIQAYVNYLFCSQPAGDEIAFELIRAYVNGCILKSNNWLVFSKALMYRSRNEVHRSKSVERSLA